MVKKTRSPEEEQGHGTAKTDDGPVILDLLKLKRIRNKDNRNQSQPSTDPRTQENWEILRRQLIKLRGWRILIRSLKENPRSTPKPHLKIVK